MKTDNMILGRIASLLAEHDGELKTAANKSATEMGLSGSAASDPGSKGGKTTHPVGKLDGNSGPAVLGSRGKENEKDLEEAYTAGVDNTEPGAGGSQDDKQYNIGTVQSATGEDPSTERAFKGNKEDPGTEHPADASEMGEKYSSLQFPALVKLAFSKINDSLAVLAGSGELVTSKSAQKVQAGRPVDEAKLAAAAGYELADALAGGMGQDKTASARALVEEVIREAQRDADNVGQLLAEYSRLRSKSAGEGMPPGMEGGAGGIDPAMLAGAVSSEGSGAGPEAGPPGGLPPGMGEAGGMPPGAGGPAEPDGDEGGGPEGMGGMGGPEGGAGAGGPGGGGDHEAAVNELFNALVELGISPEQLAAVAQGAHGGEKAAASLDSRTRAMAQQLTKYAGEIQNIHNMAVWTAQLRDAGRAKIKEAAGRLRQERDEIKNYLRESCGIR
jgi:hypothetical protein